MHVVHPSQCNSCGCGYKLGMPWVGVVLQTVHALWVGVATSWACSVGVCGYKLDMLCGWVWLQAEHALWLGT